MKRLHAVALRPRYLSIGLSLFAASLVADDLSFQSSALTAQAIDSFLSTKQYSGHTSPMMGSGSSFMKWGQTYDIDPALIVAISGIETDFALRACTTDNAWNWFWQGPCPQSPFTSYDDGIDTVSKFLKLSYINKGYNTITLIQKKYCTAPVENGVTCPGWISTVTEFRNELLGLAPNSSPVTTPTDGTPVTTPTGGMPVPTPNPSPSSGKYLWIAGGGILVAGSSGWFFGRRRKSSGMAVSR